MTDLARITLPDGRVLAFASFGDLNGVPVMFFHGGNDSRLAGRLLDTTATELSVHLIAPDRPGFGRSDHRPGRRLTDWPADVAALADHLGATRFAVLGHSGGGPHALACARALPARVHRAAVVSSPAPPPAPATGLNPIFRIVNVAMSHPRIYRRLAASQATQMQKDPGRWLAAWKRMQPADGRMFDADPHVAQVVLDEMTEALTGGIDGIVHEATLYYRDWGYALADITAPVDVWHGRADRQAAPSWAQKLAAALPQATLHMIDGLGHFSVLIEARQRILRRLTAQ